MGTPPRLSTGRQAALSLYWFATSAHWAAILITLLPLQAAQMGGDEHKGRTLGGILLIGAAVSMVVAPLFGAWSDRVRTRWGRRKPFLVVGTLGNVLGLAALAWLPTAPQTLVPYILIFIWVELFNNVATAPYSALIPDVVPKEQRGSASGWMGLMTMLGNFVGGMFGLMLNGLGGTPGAYLLLGGIMLAGMLGTVLLVKEPEPPREVTPFRWGAFFRGLAEPFKAPDFRWVFLTRLLVMLGVFTVQEYLQYFLKDVTAGGQASYEYRLMGLKVAGNAHEATSYFILALLAGAVAISLWSGALSDKYGRKPLVYLSGALQGVVALCLVMTGDFTALVLLGLVFGVGYGAYQAVDWALATDVLPSEEDTAKDMGVWHVSVTLPQVTAAPIAGVLLDHFSRVGKASGLPTLGYGVIFGLAVAYFVLGTVLVSKVKGVK